MMKMSTPDPSFNHILLYISSLKPRLRGIKKSAQPFGVLIFRRIRDFFSSEIPDKKPLKSQKKAEETQGPGFIVVLYCYSLIASGIG